MDHGRARLDGLSEKRLAVLLAHSHVHLIGFGSGPAAVKSVLYCLFV